MKRRSNSVNHGPWVRRRPIHSSRSGALHSCPKDLCPTPELDPELFFDYRETDELEPGQRWSTWDEIGGHRRPRAVARLADHRRRRDRHRARHPQDRQGSRRHPARAGDRRPSRSCSPPSATAAPSTGCSTATTPTPRDGRSGAAATGGRWPRAPPTVVRCRPGSGRWPSSAICPVLVRGLPVPYPVQLDETELLLELVTTPTATRAAAGPDPAGPRDARGVLGAARRRHAAHGPARAGPRRPVGVQHPGHR